MSPTRNPSPPQPALASCVRVYHGLSPDSGQRITLQPAFDAVWVFEAGEAMITQEKKKFAVRAGDAAFLGPFPRVQRLSEDARLMSVNFVWTDPVGRAILSAESPLIFRAAEHSGFSRETERFTSIVIKHLGNPAHLQPFPPNALSIFHAIQAAFHAWLAVCAETLVSLGFSMRRRPPPDSRLAAVQKRLDESPLDQQIDYALLSHECGISRAQIERLFRNEFGISPHTYFQRRRIAYACQALAGSTLPIKQIAGELGYSSLSAFNAWFSAREHYPPRTYRKMANWTGPRTDKE